MKRKKLLQKVLSAALAASMVMSLTAYGGSSNSTGSNASGSDSTQTTAASTEKADATAATETKEETKERQTVTFMTIDFNAGTSNTGDYAEEIKQKVEDVQADISNHSIHSCPVWTRRENTNFIYNKTFSLSSI